MAMISHRQVLLCMLPKLCKVKAQVDSGEYGNDSEYFRYLIRRDQDRRETETQLRFIFDEAEASGRVIAHRKKYGRQ